MFFLLCPSQPKTGAAPGRYIYTPCPRLQWICPYSPAQLPGGIYPTPHLHYRGKELEHTNMMCSDSSDDTGCGGIKACSEVCQRNLFACARTAYSAVRRFNCAITWLYAP